MREAIAANAPLAGVRVVEFCNVAAGPFCGMLLADMGAEVIKVEAKSGDMLRQWPPIVDGFSENFASLNRNKRSIALDLKDPSDNAVAARLIAQSDVVIENNRAGAMDRLGLAYARFAQSNPALIYCSLSAYGQTGPRAAEGGFDVTVQARSGIMSVTGEPGRDAVKCGVPVSDFSTGLYGAFAVAALHARVCRGGAGGQIDISMFGASLAISALQVSEYFGADRNPQPTGSAHPRNAPYQAFRATDGSFTLAAGNDSLWNAVCKAIGRTDLPSDPRFLGNSDRARNQAALSDILQPIFAQRTVGDWMALFEPLGIPCAPINSFSQALADPQVDHMGWVQALDLPNGRKTQTFGSPLRIDGRSPPIRRAPPELDADRDHILEELDRLERNVTGAVA